MPVGEGSRFATVSVGDTWRCVESPRFPTTIELVVVGMGFSFSFPPTAVGAESVLPLVMYQPRTEAPVMAKTKNTAKIHTQKLKRLCRPLVFFNQVLGLLFSTFATMLNLLQNWSPRSPRLGNNVSSFSPRMIGCSGANLTAEVFTGRAKTGAMGVIGGCSGCGVCGTVIAGDPRSNVSPGWRPTGVPVRDGWLRVRAETLVA